MSSCNAVIQGLGWDDEATAYCQLEEGHTGQHVTRVPQFLAKCGMGKLIAYTSDEGTQHRAYVNKGKVAKVLCWWFGTYRGYLSPSGRLCDFTASISEEEIANVRVL